MNSLINKFVARAERAGFTPEINRQILGIGIFCVTACALLTPELALAQAATSAPNIALKNGQGLGALAGNIRTSLGGATSVITALAYMGAIAFGFIGILKWKAHAEQPDRTALKIPVTYMAIAAMCAALPEVIGTGIASIWGGSAVMVPTI